MQGSIWTDEELAFVKNFDLTDEEVSERTGRSVKSVCMKRYNIKRAISGERRGLQKTGKVKDNTLGSRIQALRLEKGLTRSELGKLLEYGSEKSARNNVGQLENGVRVPSEVKLHRLAAIFGVSTDYLLTGEEVKESPKKTVKTVSEMPDPQPLKTALANHEGYMDPTAAKAVAIVMNEKKPSPSVGNRVLPKHEPKPGQIYEVLNSQLPIVIISISGENVLATTLKDRPYKNIGLVAVSCGGTTWYVDPTKMFTRRTVDLICMSGFMDLADLNRIKALYATNFGFGEIKAKEPTKADSASLRFADSVSYYNDKNKTVFEVPEGILTLQQAIDISEQMNISLTDLMKDHTEDRVLDEICTLEERIKQLKEKIGLND